jgi:hypothetical protein
LGGLLGGNASQQASKQYGKALQQGENYLQKVGSPYLDMLNGQTSGDAVGQYTYAGDPTLNLGALNGAPGSNVAPVPAGMAW